MKYMLMMHTPADAGCDYESSSWAPEDFQAHIAHMLRLDRALTDAGEKVDGQGLAAPGEARLVRAGSDGVPVTDGPFAEAKEFLAGYWIVEVDTPERAYQIAAATSAAPGPGGAPLNMPIEVRQVMSTPPADA